MRSIIVSALLLLAASSALAADGEPTRVRGTIQQMAGDAQLTVKSREGPDIEIMLAPDYQVRSVREASASDIKVGDFVGVASVPTAYGGDGALEVLIFPAAMKGSNAGSFPWDLQPNSTMTNATVSNAVEGVEGRSLTLSYPQGSKTVTLPADIPIVTFAEAEKSDLVPGATVFVPASRGTEGSLTAGFVVVGKNGVVPPM